MKRRALELKANPRLLHKSSLVKARNYFLNEYTAAVGYLREGRFLERQQSRGKRCEVRILDFSWVVVLDDLTRRIRRGENWIKQSLIEGG